MWRSFSRSFPTPSPLSSCPPVWYNVWCHQAVFLLVWRVTPVSFERSLFVTVCDSVSPCGLLFLSKTARRGAITRFITDCRDFIISSSADDTLLKTCICRTWKERSVMSAWQVSRTAWWRANIAMCKYARRLSLNTEFFGRKGPENPPQIQFTCIKCIMMWNWWRFVRKRRRKAVVAVFLGHFTGHCCTDASKGPHGTGAIIIQRAAACGLFHRPGLSFSDPYLQSHRRRPWQFSLSLFFLFCPSASHQCRGWGALTSRREGHKRLWSS